MHQGHRVDEVWPLRLVGRTAVQRRSFDQLCLRQARHIAQGLLPIPLWIPQLSFAIGSILLWLALVDELAHSNAPGLRHAKRWQDVLELLKAGITVYTTVNVQHLEASVLSDHYSRYKLTSAIG